MSQVEVDKIIPQSGTTLTIGDSGDTIAIASGATLTGDLNASNLTSGTVPDARITGAYTGITNLTMSGNLTVDTNTLFVDASANSVGIGTSSPSAPLDVNSGIANTVAFFRSSDNNANIFISDNLGSVRVGNAVSGTSGHLVFASGGNPDGTGTTEVMRIGATGNVGIGTINPGQKLDVVGSIEVSDGIYIGGTGSANKLDDYEEGTWTPTLNSGTASIFYAKYTKIGNQCTLHFYLHNFSDTTSSIDMDITGLPFTQDTSGTTVAGIGSAYGERFDYNARTVVVQSTGIRIRDGLGVSDFSDSLQYVDNNNGTDSALIGTVTYQTI